MTDATVIAVNPPPLAATDYDSGLSVPPFDTAFFSQGAQGDSQNDAVIDDLDFDFSFDDLYLPSPEELDDLLNPTLIQEFGSQSGENANSSISRHVQGEGYLGDLSSDDAGILNSGSPGLERQQISGHLDIPSPESNGSNHEIPENCRGDEKVMNWPSPDSRGSDNCGSNVSNDLKICVNRSANFPPKLNIESHKIGDVNQKAKLVAPSKRKVNISLLKRKNSEDSPRNIPESTKCKKSNCTPENSNDHSDNSRLSEEDEKRNARLMRNRESAQLSRQRKKHYVEELEEKVKTMHSTIQDLNMKISYFMTENATLRQQMGGNGSGPPPGMYPHPAMMMYPWMPCPPPYMTKQGSQVPLLPIPRLKPQQPAQVQLKAARKAESKKDERPTKIKKVAGVSFLGLIFFFMLFGCLAPMVNVRYGGVRESLTGRGSYDRLYEEHRHGRVLITNGTTCGDKCYDQRSRDNGTEPLVASLYVPRNDKLVKIDGNLIIHSVLASERAVPSGGDTALAVHGDLGPTVRVPEVKIDGGGPPELRALGSGSVDRVRRKQNVADGKVEQWFQEGLAGPMLSSGMCSEVFQFDVSAASTSGAIVPAATTRNITEGHNSNSTHLSRAKNRRILHSLPIPLSESTHNIFKKHMEKNPHNDSLNVNNSISPMVVSVLLDPREVGSDVDVDGVIKSKSLSRIFVVVLIDSVKYVTYSCMLPFKGSVHHLVTA